MPPTITPLPKPLHPAIPPLHQPPHIKRINNSHPKRPRILPTRPFHLGDPVRGKVHRIPLWQIPPRMPDIKHADVGQHQARLEDVKEPLVAYRGGHIALFRLRVEPDPSEAEVFYDAEQRPRGDEHDADVERHHRALYAAYGRYAGGDAPPVEDDGESCEGGEDEDLEEQACLDEGVACF
ncbi:hypothetical protein CPAR01_16143 [Colletotrichum paranaense]|uniref:Uncharacterized protein n=1 Tax=Colletotrichum paranaense TaxID=1914294 RepID=A0ABQ9RWU2_9PEZI|nr:uncharacterized protein CPAR01_16143 [Colletotrichum paranaense]KAK1517279.1 hypothetical protein CPAR01_16143 [Colletotrichum paranaense]